jgi:hypothetical protein
LSKAAVMPKEISEPQRVSRYSSSGAVCSENSSVEFIPISNMLASVIEPCRDRRHDPWLEYGSLTCSPAPRSS